MNKHLTGLPEPIVRWGKGKVPALGCRWCGHEERDHANRWTRGKGWHGYTMPTMKQVHARMRAFRRWLERTGYEG